MWARKTRVDNPVLCAADGPIMQLREWYHQFYTNVADLHESRRHRSIFEFDVEKRIWHAVPEQAKTRLFDL
ncbi:hypothetical protein [Burkholderia sp. BCC1999]|uniref:hypothetical protein n=1 Tax=Burkholderia sp. BCC1999 TaxID=2817448 RepID=UPI002AC33FD2|nr:hypothetical protein [Burkholderia sp. BCC1999]